MVEISRLLPSGAVCTDLDVREACARDESEAEAKLPDAVVEVRNESEVSSVLRLAQAHRIPILARGGGTARTGSGTSTQGGLVLRLEHWNQIQEVSLHDGVAVVDPGVILGDLHQAAESQQMLYAPDPSSYASCTLGGNIATNAGGPRAVKYGMTKDHVLGLRFVTATGDVLSLGNRTRKNSTGYDLSKLIVGSEGTLGVVTQATLRLRPLPQTTKTLLIFLGAETDIGPAVLQCSQADPCCLELLDSHTLALYRAAETRALIPDAAAAMLLVELDGHEVSVEHRLEELGNRLLETGALEVFVAKHQADRERMWLLRRDMSRALRRTARFKLSEDVVVPRSKIGALITECRTIAQHRGIRMPTYGHAGDGNLHVNFLWDDASEEPAVHLAIRDVFEATLRLEGTLSGEHGIGTLKAPFLPMAIGRQEIRLARDIKQRFDPAGVMNPGTLFSLNPS